MDNLFIFDLQSKFLPVFAKFVKRFVGICYEFLMISSLNVLKLKNCNKHVCGYSQIL